MRVSEMTDQQVQECWDFVGKKEHHNNLRDILQNYLERIGFSDWNDYIIEPINQIEKTQEIKENVVFVNFKR